MLASIYHGAHRSDNTGWPKLLWGPSGRLDGKGGQLCQRMFTANGGSRWSDDVDGVPALVKQPQRPGLEWTTSVASSFIPNSKRLRSLTRNICISIELNKQCGSCAQRRSVKYVHESVSDVGTRTATEAQPDWILGNFLEYEEVSNISHVPIDSEVQSLPRLRLQPPLRLEFAHIFAPDCLTAI